MKIEKELSSFLKKIIYNPNISSLFLAITIIILYFNTFNAEFIADDITAIKELEPSFKSPFYIIAHPFTIIRQILFYISYTAGGINPVFFRIWNILFHIGTVLLIYKIVPFFSKKKELPFIVSLLFAIHPVLIESVTWISGGIYAQSTFFVLLSFLFYIQNIHEYKFSKAVWAFVFFVCAISSSEKVIVYPIILFLYSYLFHSLKKTWKSIVPHLLISVIWTAILFSRIPERVAYLQELYGTGDRYYIYNPLLQIPIAIGTYLKLFFYPVRLTLFHSDYYQNTFEQSFTFILFFLFTGLLIYSFKKNKTVFFWLSLFLISLLPTLNPFNLSSVVAERYTYFGFIGLCFTAGYFLTEYIKNTKFKIILLIGMVSLLSVRTILRNMDWNNNFVFWEATVIVSPSDPKAHNSLGGEYLKRNATDLAIKEFNTAIQLSPNFYAPYYNLAVTYKFNNNPEQSLKYYLLAFEKNPSNWETCHNISILYFQKKDIVNAEKYINECINLNPQNPVLYTNLGVINKVKGDKESAKKAFEKALLLEPGSEIIQKELRELK